MEGFEEYVARVRELVIGVEPAAEEGTSYGMLAWRLAGRPLLGQSIKSTEILDNSAEHGNGGRDTRRCL